MIVAVKNAAYKFIKRMERADEALFILFVFIKQYAFFIIIFGIELN